MTAADLALANILIGYARNEYLRENDPQDGTDVVTPYDEWFYEERKGTSSMKKTIAGMLAVITLALITALAQQMLSLDTETVTAAWCTVLGCE